MKIADDVTELIGHTPLVYLNKVTAGSQAKIAAKLESFNPCASVKDRIGVSMIEDAERAGKIHARQNCPDRADQRQHRHRPRLRRRRQGLQADRHHARHDEPRAPRPAARLWRRRHSHPRPQGHESRHRQGRRDSCSKLPTASCSSNSPIPRIPKIHLETTGPEIWDDTDGKVDILISGVGTGGTITGVTEYIRPKKPSFKAIAVEPTESPVLSGGAPSPHKIQGIGAGFIPANPAHRPHQRNRPGLQRRRHHHGPPTCPRRRPADGHLVRRRRPGRRRSRQASRRTPAS